MYVRITNLTSSDIIIEGDTFENRSLTRILRVGKYFDSQLPREQIMSNASIKALEPTSISVVEVAEADDIISLVAPVGPDANGFYSPVDLYKAIASTGTTGTRVDTTLSSSLPFAMKILNVRWLPATVGATRTVASTAYANVSNVQTITCASHGIVQGDFVTFDTVTAGGDVATATMVLRTTATTIVIANAGGNSSATEAGTITVNPTVQVRSYAALQQASTAYANVSNVQTITVASHTFAVGDMVIFDTITSGGDVLTATPVISTTATTVVIANAGGNSSATEAGMISRIPYSSSSAIDSSATTTQASTLGIPLTAAIGTKLVLAKSDRNAAGTLIVSGYRA